MLCFQTIVIKIGSAVLTNPDKSLNETILVHLAKQIAKFFEEGHRILIVSSGAVASGRGIRDLTDEKRRFVRRQMYAGMGQAKLMWKYHQVFSAHEIPVAQCLITRENFANQLEHENLIKTLDGYLRFRVIPILNENDTVANQAVSFGGNDFLAALTAVSIKADKLIILSDIEGLFDSDPKTNSKAKLIPVVGRVSDNICSMAGGVCSTVGLGGMLSKLQAIKITTEAGIKTFLGKGTDPNILHKIIDTKTHTGTYFRAQMEKHPHRFKHWLRYCALPKGTITIDDGAAKAVKKRKSLLMVGVRDCTDTFRANDTVSIIDLSGKPMAVGKVKFGSDKIVSALKTKEKLGVIVHADQLTII